MKAVKVLACCALVFPLVGMVWYPLRRPMSGVSSPAESQARRAGVLAVLREAAGLYQSGRVAQALSAFERMRDLAQQEQLDDLAARAIGNIGGCQFALHQYQAALKTFLQAVRLAEKANDTSAAAVFNANIASLYSEMGELDSAAEWTESSLRRITARDRDQEGKLLIQLASLRARQERMAEAESLFARGLDAADRQGDLELYANGWNRLGEEHLKRHELAQAETALLEAYRVRRLNKLPLDSSYRNLGLLRLEQGDLTTAGTLLDRAVELGSRSKGAIPSWDIYHQRGKVRMAQGRLREALEDLRIARRLARGWRWSAPKSDEARIGTENWLEKVHGTLVEAGNRLYQESKDESLIRETFEAAEENRASSLRSLLARRATDPAELPAQYWEAVQRLQRAEIEALRTTGQSQAENAARARAEVARLELETPGAAMPHREGLLELVRAGLSADSAFLSFYTGTDASWLWALDRGTLTLHRLPSRDEIERLAQKAADAVQQGTPDANAVSGELYRILFGSLPKQIRDKRRWLVVLDTGLFDAPLAALRTDGHYLAEHHIVEAVPGAGSWLEASKRPRSRRQRLFLGVGDAIYNTADPRLKGTGSTTDLMLPRLAGSGREVEECARAWKGESVVLEGAQASNENLRHELDRNPKVLHLAVHVLESEGTRPQGLVALSFIAGRGIQLLSPQEIAAWHASPETVVLSGCHSAAGPAMPGTGPLGLTRAWLAAGASTVVASNWATPDDTGQLFHALYRRIGEGQNPAEALQGAQIEMIQSASWRSLPRYWGAYYAVGTQ